MKPVPISRKSSAPNSLWKRLGWLVVIWAASVAALGFVALILRKIMALVGLTL